MSETVSKTDGSEFPEDTFQLFLKRSPDGADKSLHSGLMEIAAMARQAFENHDRKNCLALTRAILKIDPENKDADMMERWIRSDLQEETQRVFTLIQRARLNNDLHTYEAAERVLNDVLDVDPTNANAKILLSRVDFALRGVRRMPIAAPLPKPMPRVVSASESPVRPIEPPPPKPIKSFEPAVKPQKISTEPDGMPSWLPPMLMICMIFIGIVSVVLVTGAHEWAELLHLVSPAGVPTGTLKIAIDEGIRVFIDGQEVGTSPVPELKLKPGAHEVRYQLDGVDVGSEKVTIGAGTVTTSSQRSVAARLEFEVVPATAELQIDGKSAMLVPSSLRVRAGKHRLRFTANGYEPHSVTITVQAGARRVMNISLKAIDSGATE